MIHPVHPLHPLTMIRPLVTLSYAQSLDGSLTAVAGQPLDLSGPESMLFTHQLRAAHDAILVGIGAVLADNPRLTAHRVGGPHPQPIVLDSRLRCPLDAKLLAHPRGVWIATTEAAPTDARRALEAKGARVISLPADERGRVSLPALLDRLAESKIQSVMVEGGADVITAFLTERLARRVALTIAPRFVGGLNALRLPCDVRLSNVRYQVLGEDVIVEGDIEF
jgi:3,4-dihydroxy 2-butanone 4-phosphate synthase/GTP cyclohydrolase II